MSYFKRHGIRKGRRNTDRVNDVIRERRSAHRIITFCFVNSHLYVSCNFPLTGVPSLSSFGAVFCYANPDYRRKDIVKRRNINLERNYVSYRTRHFAQTLSTFCLLVLLHTFLLNQDRKFLLPTVCIIDHLCRRWMITPQFIFHKPFPNWKILILDKRGRKKLNISREIFPISSNRLTNRTPSNRALEMCPS